MSTPPYNTKPYDDYVNGLPLNPETGGQGGSTPSGFTGDQLMGEDTNALLRTFASYLAQQRNNGGGAVGGLSTIGSLLGALSSGIKSNRIVEGNFTQNYDKLMMDAQRERNANESDALKKLSQTAYITGGGSKFTPPHLSLNGKSYDSPDLGFGPVPVTEAEKQGAGALQAQLGARLAPGGSYSPQPLSGYAKPGPGENLASGLGAGSGLAGGLLSALGGAGGSPGGASGDLGKLISDIMNHFGDHNIMGGRQTYTGRPGEFDPLSGPDNPYYYNNLPGGNGGVMPNLPGSGDLPPWWYSDPYQPGGPLFSGPTQPMGGGNDGPGGGGDKGDGGWWTNE